MTLLSGCYVNVRGQHNTAAHEQVRQRFAYEHRCTEASVHTTTVNQNEHGYITAVGAEGCRARDVFVYSGGGWVRDTPPPGAAPASN